MRGFLLKESGVVGHLLKSKILDLHSVEVMNT